MEDQVGRDLNRRPRRRVPVENGPHKVRDGAERTGAVLAGLQAIEVEGLQSLWTLSEDAVTAANADDGGGRLNRDRALVAELAADILQCALRQFGQHVAALGSGIVDELVDHQGRCFCRETEAARIR